MLRGTVSRTKFALTSEIKFSILDCVGKLGCTRDQIHCQLDHGELDDLSRSDSKSLATVANVFVLDPVDSVL